MKRNANCTSCQLHRTTTNVCIPGSGNPKARIMLVGEAPGAEEEKGGKPFIGRAGQVLDEILMKVGLDRNDLYISNAVKCRPPQNDTPTDEQMLACASYLEEEIREVDPDVIVALGNPALATLTGTPLKNVRITKMRGKPMQNRVGARATVIGTLHPASTLYGDSGNNRNMIETDFRQVVGMLEERTDQVTVTALPNSDEALDALRRLEGAATLSCDLEWTSSTESMIWPWSHLGEAYCLGLAGRIGDTIISVSAAFPMTTATREQVQKLLSKPLMFHNSTADLFWLAGAGFKHVNLKVDTMYLTYLVDETQPMGLDDVALKYAGLPGWKGVLYNERPQGEEAWRRLLEYNAMDVYATLRSGEELRATIARLPEARRKAIVRLHNAQLIPATRVLVQAAFRGFPIDEEALRQGLEDTIAKRTEAVEMLAQEIGVTPAQAGKLASSPKQAMEYLRDGLGLDLDSTRAADLADFMHYKSVEYIIAYREKNKLITTYFDPWMRLLKRQGDGRLHTVYKPTGTRTGRMSSEAEIGAPLHVIPRETWVRKMIRAVDGRKIVSGDYAQIELKAIAWKAREQTMVTLYNEGADLHRATAGMMLAMDATGGEISVEEYWADRERWMAQVVKTGRDAAKGANFGLVYGMAELKLMSYTKMEFGVTLTFEQAKMLKDGYFRLYSRILPWHEEMIEQARRYGYVETEWGRRIAIPSNNLHVAINTPIQSVASDLTVAAMIVLADRLQSTGLRAFIIGSVHDSILVDSHEDDSLEVKDLMLTVMEDVNTLTDPFGFRIPVPISADVKVGQSWVD